MKSPLTPKQTLFVEQYLVSLNATDAYRIAYGRTGKVAEANGPRMMGNARVAAAISAAQAARSERTEITADEVLKQLWLLVNANPNELVEYRRTCCRHCYGYGFDFQETQREQDRRREERVAVWATRKNKKPDDVFVFDELGGVGYDARLNPNADCPECFGMGTERMVVKDTRKLSPSAQRLYAGVKQTKDGLEVKMHDQIAALVNVAKHLGMFTEKHELTGKNGAPLIPGESLDDLTDDELVTLAARLAGAKESKAKGDVAP